MKMKQMRVRRVAKTTLTGLILVGFACLIGTANAQGLGCAHELDEETSNKALSNRGFSPYAGRGYPTDVYWGDQHVHTGWSVDAGGFGAILGPEEALRFARGEEVLSNSGQSAKLSNKLKISRNEK